MVKLNNNILQHFGTHGHIIIQNIKYKQVTYTPNLKINFVSQAEPTDVALIFVWEQSRIKM